MDEAGCANRDEVIMPVITFNVTLRRFVLAGAKPTYQTQSNWT